MSQRFDMALIGSGCGFERGVGMAYNPSLSATTQIGIIADDGDTLSVGATVFVSPEWTGHNFIGYAGLLERIQFAVDPSDNFFILDRCSNWDPPPAPR